MLTNACFEAILITSIITIEININLECYIMNLFKNTRLSLKLWLMVSPQLVALIVLTIIFVTSANDILNQNKTVLNDILYNGSKATLSADKDLYQAAEIEKALILDKTISSDEKSSLISDLNENVSQIEERAKAAFEAVKIDSSLYESFSYQGFTPKQLEENFNTNFEQWKNTYDFTTGSGDLNKRSTTFESARSSLDSLSALLNAYAREQTYTLEQRQANLANYASIAAACVTILVSILALFSIHAIVKKLKYIINLNAKIADGELTLKVDKNLISKDEVGVLMQATDDILTRLNTYVAYIEEITQSLETMADGNMKIELKQDYKGEFAPIKASLRNISSSLSTTIKAINTSAEQVRAGSEQVADASQSLASGAAEQASSIEELSASIQEVSSEVNKSAENAGKARHLAVESEEKINEGKGKMNEMLDAMEMISNSSAEISKIIKVIDDIAFQTNILALNAAVEAARAGAAGKGFAVVADEVRNLAAKSAEAAKQTNELIATSIKAVNDGRDKADLTASSLTAIEEKTTHLLKLVEDIATAAESEAAAIGQITTGINQISVVVQNNAATAEESSAASEELSSQSEILNDEVSKFILI